MEKFKVCKLGGTGCKYWNEYDMKCKKDQYKDNPELCEMFPNMGEHTKEEIKEGMKYLTQDLKEESKTLEIERYGHEL